jgi:hypothetical protein
MALLYFLTIAVLLHLASSFTVPFLGGGRRPQVSARQQQQLVPLTPSSHSSPARSTALNMFTGIVEELGTVLGLETRSDMELWDGSSGKGYELEVKSTKMLEGAYLG